MTNAELIAISAFILNAIGATVGLTWGVGKIRDQVKSELKADIDLLKQLLAESELSAERTYGEVGLALREKITQVEFFVRDNYVREKEFDLLVKSMSERFDRLQDGMDRLNAKIDRQIAGGEGTT